MKTSFRKILVFTLALVFVFSQSLVKVSAIVGYPVEATPKVQVKIAVGSTTLNNTTFLGDLKDALIAKGVDVSVLDLAFTASTNFNPADKSLWDFYDHFGEWGEVGVAEGFITAKASEDYLIAHVPGYNSTTMYVEDFYFSQPLRGYEIEYYNGTTYSTIAWPILNSVFADIAAHPMNYDQQWYEGSWYSAATTFLDGAGVDYKYFNDLFYDASAHKVFLEYYDSTWNYFSTEWPAGYAVIQSLATIDFTNDTVDSDDNYLSVEGNHGPSDNIHFDMQYEFNKSLIGLKHYPDPDSNPDNDNPVDWSNDPHIVTRDNGNVLVFYGYGAPAYKDFMISKSNSTDRKEITFDLDEAGIKYHSMQGGGFLFNVATSVNGSGHLMMNGYAILYESSGIGLYQIANVNVEDFHNEESYNLAGYSGVTRIATFTKASGSKLHSVKITVENNVLNMFDNDIQPIEDYTLPEVYGNRFGPLSSYNPHGCDELSYFTLSNLRMNTVSTVVKTIDQVVDELTWTAGAQHYLINLEDAIDTALTQTKINTIGAKLKLAKAAYIGVGSTTNKPQQQSIITANGNLGLFIPETATDVINQIVDYIFARVHPVIISNVVDIEIAKLGKPYILKSGDTATSVTGNITFLNPLKAYTGSTVKWTSNHPSNLAGTGIVNRPTYTIGDIKATATMAVTYEGITVTRAYPLTIKKLPITSAEKLSLDLAKLAIVYASGDSEISVTQKLGFTASLPQGSTVVWSSDKPAIVDMNGNVVRPAFATGDQPIVITALVSNGSETSSVIFNITVIKNAKTDKEKVEEDGSGIIKYAGGEDESNVKTIVSLANAGSVNGSTITWTSDHPDILTEKGIVARPKTGDVEVTLTATIKNGQASIVKTYKVMVKQDVTPTSSFTGYLPYLLGLVILAGAAWWFIASRKKKETV